MRDLKAARPAASLASLALLATLAACDRAARPAGAPSAAPAGAAPVDAGLAVYQKACQMCHLGGVGGAPKTGDKPQWSARLAQGRDALHRRSIEGYVGPAGVMPPKGGNLSLTDDEVRAAVDYMVAQSR